MTDFWRPELPGRRGFEFAHRVLGSKVEPLVADFTTSTSTPLGTFDVVFYLGVLYHMKEPLTCLERVRQVTTDVAVVETEAVHLQGFDGQPLLAFHRGRRPPGRLRQLVRADARGARVAVPGGRVLPGHRGPGAARGDAALVRRLRERLARKLAAGPSVRSAPSVNYRAIVHAHV